MSSSDRSYGDTLGAHSDAGLVASPAHPADGNGSWIDRMQRARGRHAAITKNLHTWSSYKSWSDQVKGAWEQGQEARKK